MAESSSSSFSDSFPSNTPLSQWDLELSQMIANMGQQALANAEGAYNHTSQITDQLISQLQTQSSQAQGYDTTLMGDYTNQIQPQINAEIQDANTYSSTARQQMDAGAAESATGQAANQGRINAEQTLQGFGIDPSAGRYQELETAQRAGASAAQAGAGQQAVLADEATGRQLRAQAIQTGQNLPGFAANFGNSAINAEGVASSAAIGTGQLGVAASEAGAPYMSAAGNALKYPPNSSTSGSSQQSSSGGGSGGGGSGGGGSGGGGSGDGSGDGSGGGGGGYDTGNYYGSGAGDNGGYSSYDGSGGGYGNDSNSGSSGDTYDSGGDSGYAAGGGVLPAPTTGGHVPPQASPSMGQNTDDVNARLNAGEFVVPRDVAAWKGQEFFQKLIEESRRKRTGAPAKGKPKPALGGPPSFQSKPMQQQPSQGMGAQ